MAVFSGKTENGRETPSRNGARGEPSLTIIATGTKLVGEIESAGVVKIEGTVVGTIRAERQVLVAREGTVEGDIHSREAILGGNVHGSVVAAQRVEVQTNAVVDGDILTDRLVVQEGGEVNGQVKMGVADTKVNQPIGMEPAPSTGSVSP